MNNRPLRQLESFFIEWKCILPDANTRLQAVTVEHGIALLAQLSEPEILSGQVVRVSEIFLEIFVYCLIPGLGQNLPSCASSFQTRTHSKQRALHKEVE